MKLGGLHKGITDTERPENSWEWGRNFVISKKYNSIVNEPGFKLPVIVGKKIIGFIPTDKEIIIFSTNNTVSSISRFKGGVNTFVLNTTTLGFTDSNQITGTFKYNSNDELVIAFCDGVNTTSNTPKILNIDNLPFVSGLTGGLELNNLTEIALAKVFPDYNVPTIDLNLLPVNYYTQFEDNSGGYIDTGMYYFMTCYGINQYDWTDWKFNTRGIPVASIDHQADPLNYGKLDETSPANTIAFETIVARRGVNETAKQVNKSIKIKIDNVDKRYRFLKLGFLHIDLNGIKTVKEYEILNIDNINTVTYYSRYTGNILQNLSLDNVLIDDFIFEGADGITNYNNQLIFGNLITKPRFDYQKYANAIKIEYIAKVFKPLCDNSPPETNIFVPNTQGFLPYVNSSPADANKIYYGNTDSCFRYRMFMPSDAYAMYIHWIYNDGSVTQGFHIPGRAMATFNDGVNIWNENALLDNTQPDSFTNYNDCNNDETILKAKYFHTRETANNSYATTKMAYWENENELYPTAQDDLYGDFEIWDVVAGAGVNTGNNIQGQKVRHHKFPMCTDFNGTIRYGYGIDVTNVLIPDDLKSQVQGWYISYAKKDINNSLIQGMGMGLASKFVNSGTGSVGAGIPADFLKGYLSPTLPNTELSMAFYDFGMLAIKPIISGTYIQSVSENFYENGSTNALINGYTTNGYTEVLLKIGGVNQQPRNNNLQIVERIEYVAGSESSAITNNFLQDEYIALIISKQGLFTQGGRAGFHTLILVNHILDLHSTFYNQTLVSTGEIQDVNTTAKANLFGGDTFYNQQTNCSIGRVGIDDINVTEQLQGFFIDEYFNNDAFSRVNYDFRFTSKDFFFDKKILNVVVYPASPTFANPNFYKYSLTFSSLLEYKVPKPYNPYLEYLTKEPYRVQRSLDLPLEYRQENWRTYPINNYYEQTKNKGSITALLSNNKILAICHEKGTFIAGLKDKLDLDTSEVFVGQGDIFDRKPDNLIDTPEGRFGLQNKYGGIVTPFGICICDLEQGKIIIVNEGVNEISYVGMRNWFYENLPVPAGFTNDDNPQDYDDTGVNKDVFGITMGYDEKFNRLIITKHTQYTDGILEVDKTETLSYSFDYKFWVCLHDYFPNYYVWNREGLFAIRNSNTGIYKMNAPQQGIQATNGRYFNINTPNKSFVDIVFNKSGLSPKLLESVYWKTNISSEFNNIDYTKYETLTAILVYTNNQCSGYIVIPTGGTWFNKIAKFLEGIWIVNKFRDLLTNNTLPFLDSRGNLITTNISAIKAFHQKNQFIDSLVVVRFEYNNILNRTVYINEVGINANNSER